MRRGESAPEAPSSRRQTGVAARTRREASGGAIREAPSLLLQEQNSPSVWYCRWPVLLLLLLALTLPFLGSYGLREPDEGRYTAASAEMLASGDYLLPLLDGRPHLTKPPMTYWLIATGLALFGPTAWGARVYLALFLLLGALITGAAGERLLGRREGRLAALVFPTMLLPYVAGSIVSTDIVLTAMTTLAAWAFWEGLKPRRGEDRTILGGRNTPLDSRYGAFRKPPLRSAPGLLALVWIALAYVALGGGFLVKGPPALVPLLVAAIYALWPRDDPASRRRFLVTLLPGLLLLTLVAAPWFLLVDQRIPGQIETWLQGEVVGRMFTAVHERNPEWYAPLTVYLPVLLLGTLPWSLGLPAMLRDGWKKKRWAALPRESRIFLLLWAVAPVLLLSCFRSRLPFYILPVFPALAILTAGAYLSGIRWRRPGTLLLVALFAGLCLVTLRPLMDLTGLGTDGSRLARRARVHLATESAPVYIVRAHLWSLGVYLPNPIHHLYSLEGVDDLARVLRKSGSDLPAAPAPGALILSRESERATFEAALHAAGLQGEPIETSEKILLWRVWGEGRGQFPESARFSARSDDSGGIR